MIFQTPLISVQELVEALAQHEIILLDCTIDKVGQSIKQEKLELIPNSLFFDIEHKLSVQNSLLPHTLVSPEIFEQEMQNVGINKTSTIVLYDRWGIYSSPRAWWMFNVMGFDNVYILNGGFPAWKDLNNPVVNSYKENSEKGDFEAKFRPEWYANKEFIFNNYNLEHVNIFDARSKGRFLGLAAEPRKRLMGGHIPNSKNIPFEEVLDGEYYKDIDKLKTLFASTKSENNLNVFTCGSGITASIIAFASHLTGNTNIKVYDGSWAEWGNEDLNLPIVK